MSLGDPYGLFCRSTVIPLPDGNTIDLNTDGETAVRFMADIMRKYINHEFAEYFEMFSRAIMYDAELAEKEFDSDYEHIEGENEEYRDALNEIESVLQQYESKVFDKKSRLYRKDLDAMLKAVHGIINEVI